MKGRYENQKVSSLEDVEVGSARLFFWVAKETSDLALSCWKIISILQRLGEIHLSNSPMLPKKTSGDWIPYIYYRAINIQFQLCQIFGIVCRKALFSKFPSSLRPRWSLHSGSSNLYACLWGSEMHQKRSSNSWMHFLGIQFCVCLSRQNTQRDYVLHLIQSFAKLHKFGMIVFLQKCVLASPRLYSLVGCWTHEALP